MLFRSSGATEGSSMGPRRDVFFLLFRDHFLDPFSEHFFMIFGPKMGPKINKKMVPKSVFFKLALGAVFLGFCAPSRRSLAVFWASWGRLGGSQERENADIPMRKPLF